MCGEAETPHYSTGEQAWSCLPSTASNYNESVACRAEESQCGQPYRVRYKTGAGGGGKRKSPADRYEEMCKQKQSHRVTGNGAS